MNDRIPEDTVEKAFQAGGKLGGGFLVDVNVNTGFTQATLPTGWISRDGSLKRTVTIKEITGTEEDILASAANGKMLWTDAVDMMLTNTMLSIDDVVSKDIIRSAVKEMSAGDRQAILIALRIASIGEQYPVEITCNECNVKSKQSVDLSTLDIQEPEDASTQSFVEDMPEGCLFSKIAWHILNGYSERSIETLVKTSASDILSYMILARIVSVDGKVFDLSTKRGVSDAVSCVKRLRLRDRDYLRTRFDKCEGGVDMRFDHECSNCGREEKMSIPMQANFFFPSAT